MTVSTTVRRPGRLKHRPLFGAAGVVGVAAAVAAAVSFGGGDHAEVAGHRDTSKAAVLASLTPEERRYVEWVVAATPEQLAAAFGRGAAHPVRPPLKPGANTR